MKFLLMVVCIVVAINLCTAFRVRSNENLPGKSTVAKGPHNVGSLQVGCNPGGASPTHEVCGLHETIKKCISDGVTNACDEWECGVPGATPYELGNEYECVCKDRFLRIRGKGCVREEDCPLPIQNHRRSSRRSRGFRG